MDFHRFVVSILLVIFINSLCISAQHEVRLQPMNVNRDWITLSGFSSGGTFAQQLQFSHSSLFSGIGVYSHGFYRCGPGDGVVTNYDNFCTTIGRFPVERLWDTNRVLIDINQYAKAGLIEDPRNLRNKKLYVYMGTQNVFFTTDMSLRILNVYEPFIGTHATIKTRVQNANYTMPSNTYGGTCTGDSTQNFYISNCGLSGAFEGLNWLLGSNAVSRLPEPNQFIALQPLLSFDQTEFSHGIKKTNMDTTGFLYIPENCLHNRNKCFLHVFFHGCFTGREFFGDQFIRNSGFLEVAELNSIIMLFPQALGSLPQNMIGCWDTYGIGGPLYATKQGPQIQVVRRMIGRILGEEDTISTYRGQAELAPYVAPYQPEPAPFRPQPTPFQPEPAPYQPNLGPFPAPFEQPAAFTSQYEEPRPINQPYESRPPYQAPPQNSIGTSYIPPSLKQHDNPRDFATVYSPKYIFPNLVGGYAKK